MHAQFRVIRGSGSKVSWLPAALAGALLSFSLSSASAASDNEQTSAVWEKVRYGLFENQPITVDTAGDVIKLETPVRAMDAAIVPVAIRSQFQQSPERYIKKLWLVVDENPSPVGAEFTLSPDSGRADIETRIRIEAYTHVRALAQLNDGSVFMAANFVKASGGCSAPAGKDLSAAMANMGRMKIRLNGDAVDGKPMLAQLMVSHPNVSGLAMDQLSRTYAPPHFVRHIEVSYGDKKVLEANVDFSISENPNFRFWFTPDGEGELTANIVDSEDKAFSQSITVRPGASSL
ncbi:MAG: quinoprotein dehydrogenase-associated SoxYZ-like carrier [Burkholderiaceae bacterium]